MSMTITNHKIVVVLLFLIVVFALISRTYKLGEIPPSVSWDEAAVGYNAFSIANWGKDEWGNVLPLVFRSFEDDKHPIHIYFTALTVKILGLSEFSTRAAPALFGVFNVIVLFFLSKIIFKTNLAGIIAALFLAVSPYSIQFSRFNHEANFALFFFMFGLLMFLMAIRGKPKLLILSAVSFGIDILTYQSALVFTPIMMFILSFMYWKELLKLRKYTILAILSFSLFILIIIFNPALLGTARFKQNALPKETIQSTDTYKKTHSELLSRLELSSKYYLSHFALPYLFISGDPIPRHSTQIVGEFFWIDAVLLPIGFLLLLLRRSRESFVILIWALLAPLPSSVSPGANGWGHAARALFTMGSWHLISVYGFLQLLKIMRNNSSKLVLGILIIIIISYQFVGYLSYYYQKYSKDQAIEWQYGFKEVAEYIIDNPEYHTVYVTDIRSQPYIFLLFYLKYPLPDYLATVQFNQSHTRPSNLISTFGKFFFAYWDPIESMPFPGVLYIVGSSAYDGLRHRQEFQVKKLVHFPDGTDAFFLVSLP